MMRVDVNVSDRNDLTRKMYVELDETRTGKDMHCGYVTVITIHV